METLEGLARNGTTGRSPDSIGITIQMGKRGRRGETSKAAASIVAHARKLGIHPQEAIARAWWFYMAVYDKATTKEANDGTR